MIIHTYTHIHTYVYIHHTNIYIHINMHIHKYITMINPPSHGTQTIVTLPQIKDILATTTATTTVKIKARTNNT